MFPETAAAAAAVGLDREREGGLVGRAGGGGGGDELIGEDDDDDAVRLKSGILSSSIASTSSASNTLLHRVDTEPCSHDDMCKLCFSNHGGAKVLFLCGVFVNCVSCYP